MNRKSSENDRKKSIHAQDSTQYPETKKKKAEINHI
jgi:hypothetical protein